MLGQLQVLHGWNEELMLCVCGYLYSWGFLYMWMCVLKSCLQTSVFAEAAVT